MNRITSFCKTCFLGAALLQSGVAVAGELPDELITDPQGEMQTWLQSGEYFEQLAPGYLEESTFSDRVTKFVYGDDGVVYMKNPIVGAVTGSYVKGTISGDELVLVLPQLILDDGDGGKYYIGRMNVESVGEQTTYVPETENSTVTYTLIDGEWMMEESGGDWILGMFAEDELMWAGLGTWNVNIRRFDGVAATPPVGLSTQKYAMRQNGSQLGRIVNVGFDGDDIWIRGLASVLPDTWVKGVEEGGRASFACPQYMGEAENYASLLFFQGAEGFGDDMTLTDSVDMDYDAATGSLSYDKNILINTEEKGIYYLDNISAPVFIPQPDEFKCQPVPARVFYVMPYNDDYGLGQCAFFFSNLTPEGYVLPIEHLFFRVFVDGELYTFYPDEYPFLENPVTEIPFTINDPTGNIMVMRDQAAFNYYFYGFDTLGVQIIYRNGDEVLEAETYNYDIATNQGGLVGVDEVNATSSTPVAEEWYDLSGQRVMNPDKGLYVKRVVYDDGHVENVKILKK